MVRSDLIEKVSEQFPEFSSQEIGMIVDIFFQQVAQHICGGGRIEIRGFGAFTTRVREAHMGYNPYTGEQTLIGAKNAIRFRPGKLLRERLQMKALGD